MTVVPNIQNKDLGNDPAQKMVETWAKNYARDDIGPRIEALRLANGCAGYDIDARLTIERAEKYLKFLRGNTA